MIERAVYNTLTNIPDLPEYIDRKTSGKLKIFFGYGYDGMNGRYIVYTLDEDTTPSVVITSANCYVNIYGDDRTDIRKAAVLVENAFDQKFIIDPEGEHTAIRSFYEDGSFIPTKDETELSHYNIQLTIRASRTAWANQL